MSPFSWSEICPSNNPGLIDLLLDQYVKAYVLRDVGRLFPGLNQDKFRIFARMLGGLSGQTVNQAEVARALGVSPPTVRDYFEIAQGPFLWRQLPAFIRNVTKRAIKHPKGYLRDSGLGHHALRIPDVTALLAHPQAGATWEGIGCGGDVPSTGTTGD